MGDNERIPLPGIINLDIRDMAEGNDLASMIRHHFSRINNHRKPRQMNMMNNQIGMNNINMNMMNQMGMNNINMNMMNQMGKNNNNMNMMNQMGMNNNNMNMMNQMGMNNNMNMMNQMGMNNNMNMMNQINCNDNIKIDEIDTKEKCLNYFFDFISFENKEKQNFKGTKLIINYYN